MPTTPQVDDDAWYIWGNAYRQMRIAQNQRDDPTTEPIAQFAISRQVGDDQSVADNLRDGDV